LFLFENIVFLIIFFDNAKYQQLVNNKHVISFRVHSRVFREFLQKNQCDSRR